MTGLMVFLLCAGTAATIVHRHHIANGFRWLGRGLAELAGAIDDLFHLRPR